MTANLPILLFPRVVGSPNNRYAQGCGYLNMHWWVATPFDRDIKGEGGRHQTVVGNWCHENCRGSYFQFDCDYSAGLCWWCFEDKADAAKCALVWDGLT